MRDLNEDYNVALMEEAAFKKKFGAEKLGGRLVNMAPVAFGPGENDMLLPGTWHLAPGSHCCCFN